MWSVQFLWLGGFCRQAALGDALRVRRARGKIR
jgi:hypothetical protein